MPAKPQPTQSDKPSDKFARSDQAPPPGKHLVPQFLSDPDTVDVVEGASEDSFPASDPPAYGKYRTNDETSHDSASD
jgi:hypothetical protein